MSDSLQASSTPGSVLPSPQPPPAAQPPHCWALVGVYGDSSCAELSEHIHCRNCPVYARAGSDLLDRPLPAEYRAAWTAYFAQARALRDSSSKSAVPFRIGSEWLALPTECLQEITERRTIHSVPYGSETLLGIVNVRGELLVCISLGHALGFPNLAPLGLLRAEYGRLLVISHNGNRMAFPVDEVHGPQRFYPADFKPPPHLLTRSNPTFSESALQWRQKTLMLLDTDLLFAAVDRNFT